MMGQLHWLLIGNNDETVYNTDKIEIENTVKDDDDNNNKGTIDESLYGNVQMVQLDALATSMSSQGENLDEYEEEKNFKEIEKILKQCDDREWEKYLYNFKKEKMTDKRVKILGNGDEIWEDLIPEYGVRIEFKKSWNQTKNDDEGNV